MWVTHSAAHQFIDRAFQGAPPLWVSEGLAGYFALFWDWTWGAGHLARIQTSSRYVPLGSLLTGSLPDYAGNGDDRVVELGMLFRYLLHHREATRIPEDGEAANSSFVTYLRSVVRGGDGAGSGFERLDSGELQDIENGFRAFDFVE